MMYTTQQENENSQLILQKAVLLLFTSVSSVAQSCPTLCSPMNCSTSGFPIHHQLLDLAPTHVHEGKWCHPTISSSVIPLSSCLQPLPAWGSFPRSQFFASGGRSIGVSASASVLQMNIQDWFPVGWTDWFDCSPTDSQESSPTPQFKSINSLVLNFLYSPTHPYTTTGKAIALTRQTFVGKVTCLLFNMLSRLVIAFLPRRKHLLISWLQSPSTVILEHKQIKSVTVSIVYPSICHEVMGLDGMILVFWMLSFKPAFSFSSFTFIKRLFSSSLLSAIKVVSSAYLWLLIFLLAVLIPACASSSLTFSMRYSECKLNKQGDNISLDILLSQFGTSLFYVQF